MLVHEAARRDLIACLDRTVDLLVIELDLGDHLLGRAAANDRGLQHGEDRRGGDDEQLVLGRLEQEEVEVAELREGIGLADRRDVVAEARADLLEIASSRVRAAIAAAGPSIISRACSRCSSVTVLAAVSRP